LKFTFKHFTLSISPKSLLVFKKSHFIVKVGFLILIILDQRLIWLISIIYLDVINLSINSRISQKPLTTVRVLDMSWLPFTQHLRIILFKANMNELILRNKNILENATESGNINQDYYIGLYSPTNDTNNWAWTDSSPYDYNNWYGGMEGLLIARLRAGLHQVFRASYIYIFSSKFCTSSLQ